MKMSKGALWIAVTAFVFCFVGVVAGAERLIINTLFLVTGIAIGQSIAFGIKRLRR
jgi:hypothetical protein